MAKDPSFLHAESEDSDQPDLSLRWAHTHFVGFGMSRLNYARLWHQIHQCMMFSVKSIHVMLAPTPDIPYSTVYYVPHQTNLGYANPITRYTTV